MSKRRKTAAQIREMGRGFFRWQDSGDLQSVRHFKNIVAVCKGTPSVSHWLPSQEVGKLIKYDRLVNEGKADPVPPNLLVRVSSVMIGDRPRQRLPLWCFTSTIDSGVGHRCPSLDQGGVCGSCRACWDRTVPNIDYRKH